MALLRGLSTSRGLFSASFLTCVLTLSCVASPTSRRLPTASSAATNDDVVWEDSNEFDLDEDGWVSQLASPSASPSSSQEYDDYDDYAADNGNGERAEFLFLPGQRDSSLMTEDEDDSADIKVRHTGRSPDGEVMIPESNSYVTTGVDVTSDVGERRPIEFADHDDDDVSSIPHPDDEDGNDDDMFEGPEEDAAEVIYGDHVFLY